MTTKTSLLPSLPSKWSFIQTVTNGVTSNIFLPGISAEHNPGKKTSAKISTTKKKHLLIMMDPNEWCLYLVYKASQHRMLKNIILGYTAFDPTRFSSFEFIQRSIDLFGNN